MYFLKEAICGDFIFITKCKMPGYGNHKKRAKKSQETSEAKERYNVRRSIERCYQLLLCNFFPGDYHLVFTYPAGTVQSTEQAKSTFSRFLRLYRQYCKQHGYKADYIYNTEVSPNGAYHHHCIMHRHRDIEYIEEMWSKAGGGSVQSRRNLWSNYDWYKLAEYFVDKTKGGTLPDTHIQGERRYVPSKGLIQPIVRIEKVDAYRWNKPKAKSGYTLIDESIRSGTDELTGGSFIKYTMRRVI